MTKIHKVIIFISIIFQTTLFSIESDLYDSATDIEKMCIDLWYYGFKSDSHALSFERCPQKELNKLIQYGHSKIFTDVPARCTNCVAGTLNFVTLDPYLNDEKKYYRFTAELIQRINDNSGLFATSSSQIIFLENLPKQKYSEKIWYEGIVLGGSGYFKYNTVGGTTKTVLRGNTLAIWEFKLY